MINGLGVASYPVGDEFFGTLNKAIDGGVPQHETNRMHFNIVAEDYVYL